MLYVSAENEPQRNPVFLQVLENIVGGVTIHISSRVPSDLQTLFEGTMLATCPTIGEYQFIKTAIVTTAHTHSQTATSIAVARHAFKVGEFIYCGDKAGGTAASCVTITAVTANAIVTAATKFGISKGSVIYECAAAAATAPKFQPYAILGESVVVRNTDLTTCYNVFANAVVRGTAVESLMPYGAAVYAKNKLSNFRFVSNKNK